jgi:hypothetical protein
MTPFKKLAKRIEKHPYHVWYCCNDLDSPIAVEFFGVFFMPSKEEVKRFNVYFDSDEENCGAWLSTRLRDKHLDNTDRITALLFADQLWQDKANRKYQRK